MPYRPGRRRPGDAVVERQPGVRIGGAGRRLPVVAQRQRGDAGLRRRGVRVHGARRARLHDRGRRRRLRQRSQQHDRILRRRRELLRDADHRRPAPAAHWDAQFREDIAPVSLGQSKVWTLHVGDTFTDVPRTNAFYRFIETVFHRGVMPGCTPEPVLLVPGRAPRPDGDVRAVEQGPVSCRRPARPGQEMFADVPAASPYCRVGRRAGAPRRGGRMRRRHLLPVAGREPRAARGVPPGDAGGPGYVPPACGAPVFNDVPASSPFCPWIEELNRRGVVGRLRRRPLLSDARRRARRRCRSSSP